MSTAADFIEHCQAVITDFEAGKFSLVEAAAKINSNPMKYPFDGRAHPMIHRLADRAFDISEDYQTAESNQADWDELVKTLKDYLAGEWYTTTWILHAMYLDAKAASSYTVAVRRKNGRTTIDSALDDLKAAVNTAAQKVSQDQTDEWYLKNLRQLLPVKIGKYQLTNADVGETLS